MTVIKIFERTILIVVAQENANHFPKRSKQEASSSGEFRLSREDPRVLAVKSDITSLFTPTLLASYNHHSVLIRLLAIES